MHPVDASWTNPLKLTENLQMHPLEALQIPMLP